jgi:hypothetical protein
MLICWLPESVRYASVCRLKSAGETQTGPVGYQTDTRHIRAAFRGRDRSRGNRGTKGRTFTTVPSHAGKIDLLYTPSSGDKAVRH